MRRVSTLLGALALLGAACASPQPGAGEVAPATTATSLAEPAATTTTAAAATTTTEAARAEGPAAPDFSLELGSGGTFRLSAEQKPVYLVFWAEW